jgi:hypothetical protein
MKIKPGLASAQQWKFTVFFSVLCTAIRQFHSRPRGFLLVTFGPHFSRILRFSRFQFPRLFCAFSCLFVAVNSAALRLRRAAFFAVKTPHPISPFPRNENHHRFAPA